MGSSIHWIEHQKQAVADAGSERPAVCSRSSCVASDRRGSAGKVGKPCTTTHCQISCSRVSRAHAGLSKEAWSTHSGVNAASSEVVLGKEMDARRNIYRRTSASEATRAMVFGRMSFEKGQAPPSRFVRQFLEDLNDLFFFRTRNRIVEVFSPLSLRSTHPHESTAKRCKKELPRTGGLMRTC